MSESASSSQGQAVERRWPLRAAIAILWVFFLVAGYFWAHKPFDAALVRGLGQTVLSILFWLGVTWLGAALGRRVAGSALVGEWPFARLALSTGAGMGLLSLLLLLLALAGVFNIWAASALLVVLALWRRRDLRAVAHDLRAVGRPRPQSTMQRWILFFTAGSLTLTFLLALAPPIAWDSLAYHLTGARFTVESGHIVHPVDIPHLGFPLLGQMQFALGMLFLDDGPAALFHYGYGLMTLGLTVALARRAFDDRAAWYAAAILLSIPSLHTLLSWSYVDGTLLFYATMAFYSFVRWRQAYEEGVEERGWLLLLGFACGFSGSVKYTAVIIPFAITLSMAWITRRDSFTALVRRLLPVAAVALALVAPYLLENWLTTGNPLYPFFFENGRFWDSWRAWWYDRPGTGLLATAPWRLPFVPVEVTILGTQGSEFYDATVGPLLVMGLGLLFLVWTALERKERSYAAHMLLFVGLNYLLWLNGVARTALLLRARFLFFIFGVLAVLGGVALSRLSALQRPSLDTPWIIRTVIALSMAFILFTHGADFVSINPLPVISGLETRESYEARRLGAYVTAMNAVNELPAASKVDFLWEARSYWCEVECWPDMILDRFLHYTQHYGFDAQSLASYWQSEGYTHVLLHDAGLDFVVERGFDPVRDTDLEILKTLQSTYLTPVAEVDETYTLYAINTSRDLTTEP